MHLGDENRHTVMRPIPTYRSTSHIGFTSSLNASNTSQIHRSSRKTPENMFFRSNLAEKNPKCGSVGRKSTYCDTTDFQPTAQQVKLGLNPFSLLLIHHKYIDQVGKPSRRCFPQHFGRKKSEMWISGTKMDIL